MEPSIRRGAKAEGDEFPRNRCRNHGIEGGRRLGGGEVLASAYEGCEIHQPEPGWAQLDAEAVWAQICRLIGRAVSQSGRDPVRALAVSSLGEAVVPLGRGGEVLAPSILNSDVRGAEYLARGKRLIRDSRLYALNGNTFGNQYGLTKLLWIRDHQPQVFDQVERFLLWGSFVAWKLGAEPVVDYSLANRTLLFDLDRESWSLELMNRAGLDPSKFPEPRPCGAAIGTVSTRLAADLGLPRGVAIINGAHDQCASAVGCGVLDEGLAACGMGTYTCLTPVFRKRPSPAKMIRRGLNTEHHAAPGRYVCFVFNKGGAWVQWFRGAFAQAEWQAARKAGQDVYSRLFAEVPEGPSSVDFVPHLDPGKEATGFPPPPLGALAGVRPETSRGEILKGIVEGVTFDLRRRLEAADAVGIRFKELRAAGGGSQSDMWVQLCADLLGRPVLRTRVREAGVLGAAIIAGVGCGAFPSLEAGSAQMVSPERLFEPQERTRRAYASHYQRYLELSAVWRGRAGQG